MKKAKKDDVGEVEGRYEFGDFPDPDDVNPDSDIQIVAMIPRPKELEADVQIAVDGTVCFKVPAKQCRTVWKRSPSGGLRRVQECFLGEVTLCMPRADWG